MQVKKFEAPTLHEALEAVKRELGPEAIILQTRNHKKGLMSKKSVEITAAASERSMLKKEFAENRLHGASREVVKKMPAAQQADVYDDFLEKHLASRLKSTKDEVEFRKRPASGAMSGIPKTARYSASAGDSTDTVSEVTVTTRRYSDIDENDRDSAKNKTKVILEDSVASPQVPIESAQAKELRDSVEM
jgi:flagellar biosynthesis GTPase FlhF